MRRETEKIYSRLGDELSKQIFESRLLYSLTDNQKHIDNIVEISQELRKRKEHILSQLQGKDVVVYGAGALGLLFIEAFGELVKIIEYCDRDKEKQKTGFCGYQVISMTDLTCKHSTNQIVLAIGDYKEVLKTLIDNGFHKESILILSEYFPTIFDTQYFDKSIPLLHKSGDVFVDAGCLDCSTILHYIRWSNDTYKKIIAFEPSALQHKVCVEKLKDIRDVTIYPYALWNENTSVSFHNEQDPQASHIIQVPSLQLEIDKVKAVKLDDILERAEVNYLKMDIEGAELNALLGSECTILNYRPKLAICVYHKPEDIIEIPSYILSLHSDYTLYLRHYSFYYSETILYAV